MRTVILTEHIKRYINGNGNVYCCLLDASKALDNINCGFFPKLLQRNVTSDSYTSLIVDGYVRQTSHVLQGNHISEYFKLSDEIK